jgi:DNA invertase Pin-like site-specific DNA recombinase
MVKDGSLDTQESRLRSYVTCRSTAEDTWDIVATYREEGASGKDLDRPQVQRLLQDVASQKLDVVLCTKIDRISRSLRDFDNLYAFFKEHHVEFVSIDESFDTGSATGRAILRIILIFAELERERTSERTKETMALRAQRGLWNGGQILGYDLGQERKGVLIVNEQEAAVVRFIFETYLETRSLSKTARACNKRGYRTRAYESRRGHLRGGKTFSKQTIHQILTNEVYLGHVQLNGKTYDGLHPALIDTDLFAKVAETLSSEAPRVLERRSHLYSYLLRDLAFCGACASSLVPHHNQTRGVPRFYYRCRGKYEGNKDCTIPAVRAEELERLVTEEVRKLANIPELQQAALNHAKAQGVARAAGFQQELRAKKAEQSRLEQEHENLLTFIRAGNATDVESVLKALRGLESRLNELKAELAGLEARKGARQPAIDEQAIADGLEFFDTVYDLMEPEDKAVLLKTFVQRVTYTPETVKLYLYNDPLDDATKAYLKEAVTTVSLGSMRRQEWLPAVDDSPNNHRQQAPEAARICHEVPVAVTRLAHNRHVLSHRADAPTDKRVGPKPKPTVSVVEVAQELDRMLKTGEASTQSELARRLQLTRPRVTQLLNLLQLAKPIQRYLIKTRDADGRIRERHLRPLTQVNGGTQLKLFRKLAGGVPCPSQARR